MRRAFAPLLFLFLGVAACLRASQEEVTYDAVAEVRLSRTFSSGEYTIDLLYGHLAFGPAYFCAASHGAPTECESAIAEIRSGSRIDLLGAPRQPLGVVRGFTGPVKSVSYDLGIDWFDTQTSATARPEAPDGHSLVVRGTARRPGAEIPFVVTLDVAPQYQGQRAISTAPAIADVKGPGARLVVRFDAQVWLEALDFARIEASPDRPYVVAPGKDGHDAILVSLKNLRPPEFHWETTQ